MAGLSTLQFEKLHEQYPDQPPRAEEARAIAEDTFHLKHVKPSGDPDNRPGPFERAKNKAADLVEEYAKSFGSDFQQRRQVEERFELPIKDAVVSGSIDLMIQEDERGNVVDACVVDFKAIEGGPEPEINKDLEWTELSLQVQLYAKAATDVVGEAVKAGHVHLLKDNQRIPVPVDDAAVTAAVTNIEWAVDGIMAGAFPMRPHQLKCERCDFAQICPTRPERFAHGEPPPIHVPGNPGMRKVGAFELFDPKFRGLRPK